MVVTTDVILCGNCKHPVVYWGSSKEWRHVGGTAFCTQIRATPGDRVYRWKYTNECPPNA